MDTILVSTIPTFQTQTSGRNFNYNKSERLTIQTKVAKYRNIMLT